MRTVRIVDRGIAQQHGIVSAASQPMSKDPGRPSVDEKRAYYWSGPGWIAAFNEARRLLANGFSSEKAALQVGWTKEDLEEALRRDGKPPDPPPPGSPDDFRPRERPRRTVKQRVAGLHGISKETQELARRYYETEVMTVREVAKALGEPYEKTYLILILAKTKFRRPGRRGADAKTAPKFSAQDVRPEVRPDDRTESRPDKVTPVLAPPEIKRRKKKPRRATSQGEIEKARRRVLGGKAEKKPVVRTKQKSKRDVRKRESKSERDKAFRRVLG